MSLILDIEPPRNIHPVDIIEHIATLQDWSFERQDIDEIAISIRGSWSDYQVSFTWMEDLESVHVACAFDVRVQEVYGLARHPTVAGVPLTLSLLSPAHRPIQTTKDLPGFWKGSWKDVRADMRGRYPRHVWPEDPATATPTTRAKPRGT